MAIIVTVCIMVITVYTVMGFKNRKSMCKNIETILEELEYQNRPPKRPSWQKRKKEEVEENEENEPED